MKYGMDCLCMIGVIVSWAAGAPGIVPSMPMPIPFEDTIRHRWLNKAVLANRLLDNMENLDNWSPDNCYNYKEVWVHPSSRWLWMMCDLYEAGLEPSASTSN